MPNIDRLLDLRRVFTLVVFLGLVSLAARRVVDPDLWWHLRTGHLTIENGAVFHTDPFSFTRAGQPWINHEWLADVAMYELHRAAGWGGLILISALLWTIAYSLAFRRAGKSYTAGVVTLAGAFASLPVWDVRPQVFSVLFASALLGLNDAAESRPRQLWWAVPLMFLWVNLHAGYALGIALLFLFLLGDVLEYFLHGKGQGFRTRLMAFVACLAVVPLNPYGFRMYGYPLATLRSSSMQNYIQEWFSPNFHDPQYLPLALVLLAVFALLALSSRRLHAGEMILLAFGVLAALVSVRHIAIFALIATPILSKLLGDFLPKNDRVPVRSLGMAAVNAALLVCFTIFVVVHVRQTIQRQPAVEREQFPAKAVEYLASHELPGNLLNHYDWGGYLIWRLYPSTLVFCDGRADVYGDAVMKEFADVSTLRGDWNGVLERWQIRTVLMPPDSPLITALKASGRWQMAYRDSQAVILIR